MTLSLIFLVCFFTYTIIMTIIAFVYWEAYSKPATVFKRSCAPSHCVPQKLCGRSGHHPHLPYICCKQSVLISQFLCQHSALKAYHLLCHSGARSLTVSPWYIPASLYHSDARHLLCHSGAHSLTVSQCLSHQRTQMRSSCLPSGRVSWAMWDLLLISLSAWEGALDNFTSQNISFSSS